MFMYRYVKVASELFKLCDTFFVTSFKFANAFFFLSASLSFLYPVVCNNILCTEFIDVWMIELYCSFVRSLYSYLSRSDSVTISVWNSRKVHKRQGAGFLGCVRLNPGSIARLKDTGC